MRATQIVHQNWFDAYVRGYQLPGGLFLLVLDYYYSYAGLISDLRVLCEYQCVGLCRLLFV